MGISSFAAGFLESASEGLKESKKRAEELAEKRKQARVIEIAQMKQKAKALEKVFKARKKSIEEANVNINLTSMAAIITDDQKYATFMKGVETATPQDLQNFFVPSADSYKVKNLNQRLELVALEKSKTGAEVGYTSPTRKALGFLPISTKSFLKEGAAEAGVSEEEFKSMGATTLPEIKGTVDVKFGSKSDIKKSKTNVETSLFRVNETIKGLDPNSPDYKVNLSKLEKEQEELKGTLATINVIENKGDGAKLTTAQTATILKGMYKNILGTSPVPIIGQNIETDPDGTIRFKSGITKEQKLQTSLAYLRAFENSLRQSGSTAFIKDLNKPMYDRKTGKIFFDNLHENTKSALVMFPILNAAAQVTGVASIQSVQKSKDQEKQPIFDQQDYKYNGPLDNDPNITITTPTPNKTKPMSDADKKRYSDLKKLEKRVIPGFNKSNIKKQIKELESKYGII